jgi:hypothetical protein
MSIAEAFGEIFCPSEETLKRRAEAEQRRREKLGAWGRLKEDVKEWLIGILWGAFCLFTLGIAIVPWVVGASTIWHWVFR